MRSMSWHTTTIRTGKTPLHPQSTPRNSSDSGESIRTNGGTCWPDQCKPSSTLPQPTNQQPTSRPSHLFHERCQTGAAGEMTEGEMTHLAHDLIRATAERHPEVGSRPLQTAVLRKGQDVTYDQPIKATEMPTLLSLNGSWHLGVDFTL